MLLEVVAIVLGSVAILVSVTTILVAVLFHVWQKRQGERIAVSVISTADQIYRRLRGSGPDNYVPEDIVKPSVSDRYIRRATEVKLGLKGYLTSSLMGGLEARCIVEEPLGGRAELVRNAQLTDGSLGSFDLQVIYPCDFGGGSTSEPGRYHIWWCLRDRWVLVEADKETPGSAEMGRVEDSFTVMP